MPDTTSELLIDASLLKKIEGLQLVSRRLYTGGQTGSRKSRTKGAGMEFADHRHYSPGDDFRNIDWNVYARLDDLILKTFETEQNLHVSILFDCSESMAFGEPSKMQLAASIAAAIAYISLVNEDGLTLSSIADTVRGEMSSSQQQLSPEQVFDFCSTVEVGGRTYLDETLRAFGFHSQHPGLLFIISDFLFAGKLEDTLQPLIYGGFDICGIQILAKEELNPIFAGEMDIVDSETDETISITVRDDTRKIYGDALDRFVRNTEAGLKMCHANYVRATTDMSVERIVLGELRSLGVIRE